MRKHSGLIEAGAIERRILLIRGEKVMVDADLAAFYANPARCTVSILVALALLAQPGSVREARQPDRRLEARRRDFVVISNVGEEQARRVSQQFERVRTVLQPALMNAPVDVGQPVVVLAVDNEDSLRELLPQFCERKVSARWPRTGVVRTGTASCCEWMLQNGNGSAESFTNTCTC